MKSSDFLPSSITSLWIAQLLWKAKVLPSSTMFDSTALALAMKHRNAPDLEFFMNILDEINRTWDCDTERFFLSRRMPQIVYM